MLKATSEADFKLRRAESDHKIFEKKVLLLGKLFQPAEKFNFRWKRVLSVSTISARLAANQRQVFIEEVQSQSLVESKQMARKEGLRRLRKIIWWDHWKLLLELLRNVQFAAAWKKQSCFKTLRCGMWVNCHSSSATSVLQLRLTLFFVALAHPPARRRTASPASPGSLKRARR